MTYFFHLFFFFEILLDGQVTLGAKIATHFHYLCVVVTNKLIFFSLWKPLIHSHSLYKLLELTCENGRNNWQHCWANIVGSCCIRVSSGVQTDATYISQCRGLQCIVGRIQPIRLLTWRPCVIRVAPAFGPNNVGRARAPSPDRIERTVQTDPTVRQTQTVD